MARYSFLLDDLRIQSVIEETVEARDDEEVEVLARLRLTLTTEYAQVVVMRDGRQIIHLVRDSLGAPRPFNLGDET